MKIKMTPEEDAAFIRCCNCILDMFLQYHGEIFGDMQPQNTQEQDCQVSAKSLTSE